MNRKDPAPGSAFMARLLAQRDRLAREGRLPHQVSTKPAKRPTPPPLVDQIREVLAGWPESQRRKISALVLLPHLQGKYRERTHLRTMGAALRALGYRQAPRTWGKDDPDFGRRFWVLDKTN